MLYSSSKKLLNETREYTAAEIFNSTESVVATNNKSIENAIAAMPPRVNITLESYDLANMGGDLAALGAHCVIGLLLLLIIEAGIWFTCCHCKSDKRG